MAGLRDELRGSATAPTPYRMLCPPGWQRLSPKDVVGGAAAPVLDALKSAGRPELVLELRRMLTDFTQASRRAQTVDVYLAPAAEDAPLPATMVVSRFRLPEGVSWESACARLAQGAEVWQADFTETFMWTWVTETPAGAGAGAGDARARAGGTAGEGGSAPADTVSLLNRVNHFLVPVPEEPSERALYFQYSLLEVPLEHYLDGEARRTSVRALGDLMMSTMRWVG